MQKLISKYGLAAHLALVAVAPLFLSPIAVIMLSVLAFVWLVMEPSRVGNEMLHDARRRVLWNVITDPLFWIFIFLVIVSVVRMFNVGVAMAYDAETGKWFVSQSAFPLLPGSVEGCGTPLVGCAVAAGVTVMGCRHGLGRSARNAFALIASLLSGVGGYVWAFLSREVVASPIVAIDSPVLNPLFSGSAYGIFLVCSIVSLVSVFESHLIRVIPLTFVGISGNLLGLVLFSPPVIAVAYAGAALLIALYSFVYIRIRLGRTAEFKFLVLLGLSITLAFFAFSGTLPTKFTEARLEPYLAWTMVPEGYFETRTVLSDIAMRVWKSNPWLGTGLGAFPLDLQFAATPADWQTVSPFQKAVPNGFWMLLAERGVIGAFFLAVPLALLLIFYVRRLVSGVTRALPQPLAWAGFVLLLVAAAETVFDYSYLMPGVAVALVSVFTLSGAAFPKEMSSHG